MPAERLVMPRMFPAAARVPHLDGAHPEVLAPHYQIIVGKRYRRYFGASRVAGSEVPGHDGGRRNRGGGNAAP